MRLPRDKDVLENARALRKSMTREERHLWYDFLRGYSPRFVRQKVVGCYILDFYCDAAGLAIELDGSQHMKRRDSCTMHSARNIWRASESECCGFPIWM